ncbi:MAG: hypothetical protein AAGI28_00760 [Pseudomonadota bacterium]
MTISRNYIKNWLPIGLVLVLIGTFPFYAPIACTSPDRATDTLLAQGYTQIQIDGYAYLDCGQDDVFATAFKAKSPSGQPVEGAVCSGLFKGNTVRLD